MKGLENVIAVDAQLGRLRRALETDPWSECVKASVMSMLRSLRAGWAQQCSAFSEGRNFGLEDSELRISSCKSDVVPCLLFIGNMRRGREDAR